MDQLNILLLISFTLMVICNIVILVINQKLLKLLKLATETMKEMQRDISFYENAVNILTLSIRDKNMYDALMNASEHAEFYVQCLYDEVKKLIEKENNNEKDIIP